MSSNERWLLPDGIDELVPPDAWRMEQLRRRITDQFYAWGYELVMPPLVEYLDSLLTGTGEDLDLQTYKIIDQQSGRLMGVRADMTPQIARIQSRLSTTNNVTRLCYVGPVLNIQQDVSGGSREPMQVGAELFGSSSIEAECELIELMVGVLKAVGIGDIHVDLGHVGIFRTMATQAGLSRHQESQVFDALHRKSRPDIEQLFDAYSIDAVWKERFLRLTSLHGAVSDLESKSKCISAISENIAQAVGRVNQVANLLRKRLVDVTLHYDLAELHGYRYYTGIVFSAFIPGHGQVIARGGRYDDIGKAFGRQRPATGFSTDMRRLLQVSLQQNDGKDDLISAPLNDDRSLDSTVQKLRGQGKRIIRRLPDEEDGEGPELHLNDKGEWAVCSKS